MKTVGKDLRKSKGLTIGLRNNNPLNLRPSYKGGKVEKWQGMVAENVGGFMQFTNTLYGIRAGAIDILGDINKGKNTLNLLIAEFAPASENNTSAYVKFVSSRSGFAPNEILKPTADTLERIISAKVAQENGDKLAKEYVTPEEIKLGVYYALNRNLTLKPTTGTVNGGEAAVSFAVLFLFFFLIYKFLLA